MTDRASLLAILNTTQPLNLDMLTIFQLGEDLSFLVYRGMLDFPAVCDALALAPHFVDRGYSYTTVLRRAECKKSPSFPGMFGAYSMDTSPHIKTSNNPRDITLPCQIRQVRNSHKRGNYIIFLYVMARQSKPTIYTIQNMIVLFHHTLQFVLRNLLPRDDPRRVSRSGMYVLFNILGPHDRMAMWVACGTM